MDPQPAPVTPLDPKAALQTMLDKLGFHTKVEQYKQDDEILLHIATVDPGSIIGKQGQTLNQLQFLLNRMLLRADPNAPRVIVDCERYREGERDQLIRKALDAADRVRRWGEPVTIGPFRAFDRRIIHKHIENDPELEAISEEGGEEGAPKKMLIRVRQK